MSCSCPTKIQLTGTAFIGDSAANPFTALELYEASKLNDWDCVNTLDGVNYNVTTNIEVGNGVDLTVLIISGKNIIFDTGKDFIPNPPCIIKVGTVWTQQEKDLLFSSLEDIKGTGFVKDVDSLVNIPDAVLDELA